MNIELNRAIGLYNKQLYVEAFLLFQNLAKQGISKADSYLGLMYSFGEGVERDIAKAILYLEKAAVNGEASAAHNLGTLYVTCEPEIQNDPEKARYWWLKAKEMGFVVTHENFYENLK